MNPFVPPWCLIFVTCSLVWTESKRHVLLGKYDEKSVQSRPTESPIKKLWKHYKQADFETLLCSYWINTQRKKVKGGPDYFLFQEFQRYSGMRAEYVAPVVKTLGAIVNGSYNGELGLIQRGDVDVSNNVFAMLLERLSFAEYTAPIRYTSLCVMMRRAPRMGFAEILKLPFQPRAWVAIVSSLLLAALTWHATHRHRHSTAWCPGGGCTERTALPKRARPSASPARALLDVAQVAFSGGCSRPARRLPQRAALAAALLFVLVLANAYQGVLLGFMAAPPRHPDPQTLAEGLPQLREVFAYLKFYGIFQDPDSGPALRLLGHKWRLIQFNDMEDYVADILRTGQDGIITSDIFYHYLSRLRKFTKDGERLVHRIPDCVPAGGHNAYLVRRGSPLYGAVNAFVLRVAQSGVYEQWWRVQGRRMDTDGVTVPFAEGQDHPAAVRRRKPLALRQLKGPFALLLLGLGAATAGFVGERLGRWVAARRRHTPP